MFSGCTKLEKLNLSSFDFAKITNIRALFYNCNKLKEINLSGADFSNITDVTNTFEYVSADVKIYIDCRQQSKFVELFGSKSGLTTVNNEYCSS
jgi:surface protein